METHKFDLIDFVDDGFFYSLFIKCLERVGFGGTLIRALKSVASIDKQSIAKVAFNYIDDNVHSWVYDAIIPFESLPEWMNELDNVFGVSFSADIDSMLCKACRIFESVLDDMKYKRLEGITYTD